MGANVQKNKIDVKKIDRIIEGYDKSEESLLAILQDFQRAFQYVPEEGMKRLSRAMGVPESKIYAMGTFYKALSLKPRGKHTCKVCMGTACHVKGAVGILTALETMLDLPETASDDGKFSVTTKDNRFTVEIARCFGACSMAPVLQIDGTLYGYTTPNTLPAILEQYGWRKP